MDDRTAIASVPDLRSTPKQILVICTRRIGDVLLATPVVRTLRSAFSEAAIDFLAFAGTAGVLVGNPDLRAVIAVPERPGLAEHLALLRRLRRRYDLAVSLLPGDRPTLYAWIAARRRIGTLAEDRKSRWKRALLDAWVPFDNLGTHTVAMNLEVIEHLGLRARPAPVVAWDAAAEAEAKSVFPEIEAARHAVLHVSPKFAYKSWTETGWVVLARHLQERGLRVLLAGGASPEERRFVDATFAAMPAGAVNLAGRTSLAALAFLLSKAALYVGTDTAVTHMAAALGVPTVALFGPSNPVKWGPWPAAYADLSRSPWSMRGSAQVGNVFLVQGETTCVPCLLEGCERHVKSQSDCLQHLPAARVIAAAEAVMAGAPRRVIPLSVVPERGV